MNKETIISASDLSTILETAAKRWNVPGAACAIWHDGSLTKASSGVLNSETSLRVQPNSMFQIGSITKVLTATLVMILRDRGLVDLDEPFQTYVPDFAVADAEATRTITVRQMLNHTNGLAGDFMPDTGMGRDSLERILDRSALLPLCHPVGGGFSYSNSAYCLVGLLVERLTGKSFDEAMVDLLFAPMGLKDSVITPHFAVGRSAAMGHVPDPEDPTKMKPVASNFMIAPSTAPAGATPMMSVADVIAFARMHMDSGVAPNGERILSADAVAEMQKMETVVPVPQRDISHWGLGWFFSANTPVTLYGHDGGTIGQYSFLRIHEESNTAIILLTNGGQYNDCMFELFEKTLTPLTGFEHSPPVKAEDQLPKQPERFIGTFETIATVTRFHIEGDKILRNATMTLASQSFPEPETELEYAGGDTFIYRRPGAKYPATVTFMDFDEQGVSHSMFTGLRMARRVN
ncbi:MAG: serine hydrolase domain-containing protein [Pseudomonadota bacterium]